MNEQKRLVPKLQFPEFQNAGEWSCEKIDDLVDTVAPPKKLPTSSYGLVGKFPIIDQSQSEVCGWTDDSDALINEGLPLIIFGDHTCVLKFLSQPFVQGADGIKILKSRPKITTSYLYQYLNYQPVVTEEYKRHYSILKEKLVFFPQHRTGEQQKIADCLSSLDELIAAQARKVEALKTHKKGLMQQLFPREGETQPRLRFPEFQDAGEWCEEALDDLAHFQDGFAFKSTDFVKAEEDATQVIRITDINNKNSNEDKVYIPASFLERNKLGKYLVDDGDLLLSLTGAAGFNFFFWNGGSAAINQRTAKVTFKRDSGNALLRLLEPLIYEKINERGEGQNNNLSKEFLGTIVLRIPEPAEQQCIADCLTALDTLITAATQELDTLKTHKKGLMQQLFPSAEAVEA
jgi:type I restriction enzyme S subunit